MYHISRERHYLRTCTLIEFKKVNYSPFDFEKNNQIPTQSLKSFALLVPLAEAFYVLYIESNNKNN